VKAARKKEKREKLKGDPPQIIVIIMVVNKIREVVDIRDLIRLAEVVISTKEVAEAGTR
jgi:hypothetical protein